MAASVMTSPEERPKPRFNYGYVIVAGCFLIMVVVWGTFYSFGVFFKPVLEEFGWTRAATSGAYSLAMLLSGLLGIYVGSLNDRFGPRVVLASCGVSFGAGYLLMSSIHSLWQIYLYFGLLISLGMSGFYAPVVSTAIRWFSRRRGIIMGVVVSGIGIGNIIMPLLANKLISLNGWRPSFAIFGAICLVVVPAAAYFLRRDPTQMARLPYGAAQATNASLEQTRQDFSVGEAIRTRAFWMLWTAYFIYGFNVQAAMVHIVPHTTDLGIPAILASGLLALIGGISIPGRLATGIASDRIGTRFSLVFNFGVLTLSMFWLAAASDLWMFYLFAAVFGLAYGGLAILNPVIAAELFGLKANGAIVGMVAFGFQTGGALGPLLAGYVFDATGSYYPAFLICGTSAAAGILLSLLLKPPVDRKELLK